MVNKELGMKDMKVTANVIKLWLFSVFFGALVNAAYEQGEEIIMLYVAVVTVITVTAMYGSFMVDSGVFMKGLFNAIRLAVSIVATIALVIFLMHCEMLSLSFSLDCVAAVATLFLITLITVVVGSSAVISLSWCLSDVRK